MELKQRVVILPIRIPIYDIDLTFIYGSDFKLLNEWLEEDLPPSKTLKHYKKLLKYYEKRQDTLLGLYSFNKDERVLYIKAVNNFGELTGTLAHELLHVCFEILKYKGLKPSKDSEEAYAYLQGYLMEIIMDEMLNAF